MREGEEEEEEDTERERSEGDQQRILVTQKMVAVNLFLCTVLEMTWNCSTDTGKTG